MDEEDIYFQDVTLRLERPNGSVVERTFIGLAGWTPDEFEQMKKEEKTAFPKEDDKLPLRFGEPYHISKLTGDAVEQVREELEQRKEDLDELQNDDEQ